MYMMYVQMNQSKENTSNGRVYNTLHEVIRLKLPFLGWFGMMVCLEVEMVN